MLNKQCIMVEAVNIICCNRQTEEPY